MNEVFSVLLLSAAVAQPWGGVPPPYALPNRAYGPVGPAGYGPVNPRAFGPAYGAVFPPAASSSSSSSGAAPTIAPSPSIFALNNAKLGINAEIYLDEGNNPIGFYVSSPYSALNPTEKAKGQEIYLQQYEQQARHLVRTSNATQANINALDDIQLNEMATNDQIARRNAQALPSAFTPVAKSYDEDSRKDWETLARNALDDAQAAYAKNPTYTNWVAVQSARDCIKENQDLINGDQADIISNVAGIKALGVVGPLSRRKESALALANERRNNKNLRAIYAQTPNENNWWALRLSNVKLKALKADLKGEQGEVLSSASVAALTGLGSAAGIAIEAQQFKVEEDNWKKYNQLLFANLLRQRAESAQEAQAAQAAASQSSSSVETRMLALSNYGSSSS